MKVEFQTIIESDTSDLDGVIHPDEQIVPLKIMYKAKICLDGKVDKLKECIVVCRDIHK
jgi:hypothetical protein